MFSADRDICSTLLDLNFSDFYWSENGMCTDVLVQVCQWSTGQIKPARH